MHRSPLARSRAVLLLMLWLAAGCGKPAQPENGRAPRALARVAQAGSGAAPTASSAAPAPAPAVAQALAEPRPAALVIGEWTETASFRFRVTDLRRCRTAGRARAAAAPSEEPARLAVGVQVEAHYDLFVSPRDLALERAGVIFPSEPEAGRAAGCGRLLQPQALRRGQAASGAVVFALPEAAARESLLVFAPTRWGGAPRVALAMPDCRGGAACGRSGKRARAGEAE